MSYYLIGLFLSLSCAWRVRRQQQGKRLLPCNILVLLCALMYAPYILRSLNSPLPMHAFFVALDACPLLAVLPLLFYSRRHPVRWAVATLICGIVAAFFLCYLLYVQQIILSTPYGAPVPFWVEIWLPVSLLHVESNSFTKVFPCDITSL